MKLEINQRKIFGRDLESLDERIERRIRKPDDEVLVFGSGKEIYAFDGEKVVKVAERDDVVYALAVYNGKLYDGGYKKIYKTLSNEVVAERDGWVCALAVYNGELYDGGSYKKIFKTLSNVVVAERDSWVETLAVYNGELYDGGNYKKIYKTLSNEVVAERDKWVYALAVYNGKLYDGGNYGKIYKTLSNEVVLSGYFVTCMISVKRSILKGLI